VDNIQAAVT